VAATVNVAACPRFTVALTGCVVIEGAEFSAGGAGGSDCLAEQPNNVTNAMANATAKERRLLGHKGGNAGECAAAVWFVGVGIVVNKMRSTPDTRGPSIVLGTRWTKLEQVPLPNPQLRLEVTTRCRTA